jgi:hypothetical protein
MPDLQGFLSEAPARLFEMAKLSSDDREYLGE